MKSERVPRLSYLPGISGFRVCSKAVPNPRAQYQIQGHKVRNRTSDVRLSALAGRTTAGGGVVEGNS